MIEGIYPRVPANADETDETLSPRPQPAVQA